MRTVDIREQEIFLEAIEIASPVARLDFVYQACQGNANLRDRVEQLLQLQTGDSFILDREVTLDQDGSIRTNANEFADLTGKMIGDKYHLVRQIGSGGMGDVYLAEQKLPIRRRVAVKVIKFGLDTRSFVARFNAERQALAVMDHHGITKVYDAGSTKTGRPYFVMELVSGEDITRFCDENRLTLEQRLQIFQDLCKSIQHAHQKGLIHRDLKPSNILVSKKDGEFVSKVIDFGVSKATHGRRPGQTDLTRLACMIGTPDYMSPEQTDTQGNDQDIRTDVYSLGAILFELLTGSTTFELEEFKKKNIFTIREIIQTRSVVAPSTRVIQLTDRKPQVFRDRNLGVNELAAALRGNLDAVVLKCLAKDRAERYPTVAELAADIDRHLQGEAVAVVRQSPIAYGLRTVKKHRWLLSISLTIATLLVAISVFSLISAANANRYAEKAMAAEALAKQRLKQLVVAQRDTQLEKSRSRSFEKLYREQNLAYRNERAVMSAIAEFYALQNKPDGRSRDLAVSQWLRLKLSSRFDSRISDLIPLNSSRSSDRGDSVLLQLIAQMQRAEFGASHELLAETLDLLGEKYLNSRQYSRASRVLRDSLYIHTENDNESEVRLRTMILLARSLKLEGHDSEAESYLHTIRRNLEKLPVNSRLHQMIPDFDSE